MGRKKSGLEDRNLYQRRVVAWRVAEMLVGDALGRPHPDVIRVEVNEAGDWDDLQEQYGERIDRWQVKRQQEALPTETLRGLVEALREPSGVSGHILFMSDVEIRSGPAESEGKRPNAARIGTLRELRAMSDRWRGYDVDLPAATAALTASERPLFEAIAGWTGSPEAAVGVTSRLTVERARTMADLEHEGKDACARIFDDADTAWTRITTRVEEVRHGEQELRPGDLWERLAYCALQPGLRAPHHIRAAYLSFAIDEARAERPLHGLVGADLSIPLWDLWVNRSVRWDQPLLPTTTPRVDPPPTDKNVRNVEAMRDDLVRVLQAPPTRLLTLYSEAGMGKTQLLRRTWADLAHQAIEHPDAPVPFLLTARDLARATTDEAIAAARGRDAEQVHRQREPRLYLVDGLDEVSPQEQAQVKARLGEMAADTRTLAVLVSCRPSHRVVAPAEARALWLDPWSDADAEALVMRWEGHDVEAVQRLRQAPHAGSLRTNPLILTLALWVARFEPNALGSRARVYSRVVEQLVLAWPEGRGAPADAISERWEELAPRLGELAWQMVSKSASDLDQAEVEQRLRQVRPARQMLWLDWADRQFGLLVRKGERRYSFLLRPLAEHLAGLHLATREDAEILAAADQLWGAEVVRHALGHLSDQGEHARVRGLLAALVEGWEHDFQTALGLKILVRPVHLRRVLVAARAVADLDESVGPMAAQLAEVFWAYLSEETSVWVGDRMAAAAEEIAAAGGGVWDALFLNIRSALIAGPEPRIAERPEDLWVDAIPGVLHRHPRVRAAALRAMRPASHEPAMLPLLTSMIQERSISAIITGDLPAIEAALLLRQLPRGDGYPQLLPWLRSMLDWTEQLSPAVAAVALRPEEADPGTLMRALARIPNGRLVPRAVVADLRATEEGERSFQELPEAVRRKFEAPIGAETILLATFGDRSHLRSFIKPLGRISQIDTDCARKLIHAARDLQDPNAMEIVARLCEHDEGLFKAYIGIDDPYTHLPGNPPPMRDISLAAQHILGAAALRNPRLQDYLLQLWDSLQERQGEVWMYPGHAVGHLLPLDEDRWVEIYSRWACRPGFWREHTPVPVTIGSLPKVQIAMRHILFEWWSGLVREVAKGTIIDWPGCAAYLYAWRQAWAGVSAIEDLLIPWIEQGPPPRSLALLLAFSGPPWSDAILDRLSGTLRETLLDTALWADRGEQRRLVTLVNRLSQAPSQTTMAPIWRALKDLKVNDWSTIAASIAQMRNAAGMARETHGAELSVLYSANIAMFEETGWLPEAVAAAPSAFVELCRRLLASHDVVSAIRLLPTLMGAIPHAEAAHLLAEIGKSGILSSAIPYVSIGTDAFQQARPLDLLDRLTYDLGLPLLNG